MDTEKHIERIKEILTTIPVDQMTILTGGNGHGKSLIRKQMPYAVQRAHPEVQDKDLPKVCKSVSMQLRTESRAEFGALSSMMHNMPWNPTSTETYSLIKRLFFNCFKEDDDKKYYLIIDEPEIGMAREPQVSIARYIKMRFEECRDRMYGLLVTTHSEDIVKELIDVAAFIDINGCEDAKSWLNREIIPTDFEQLTKESNELYQAINENSKKKT